MLWSYKTKYSTSRCQIPLLQITKIKMLTQVDLKSQDMIMENTIIDHLEGMQRNNGCMIEIMYMGINIL